MLSIPKTTPAMAFEASMTDVRQNFELALERLSDLSYVSLLIIWLMVSFWLIAVSFWLVPDGPVISLLAKHSPITPRGYAMVFCLLIPTLPACYFLFRSGWVLILAMLPFFFILFLQAGEALTTSGASYYPVIISAVLASLIFFTYLGVLKLDTQVQVNRLLSQSNRELADRVSALQTQVDALKQPGETSGES